MFRRRKPDVLRGALDLLILKTLTRGPQHGYGIVSFVHAMSDDELRVEEGSLYPALHRMEQSGWIAAEWQVTAKNRRARVYRLTARGRARLADERAEWIRLTAAVGKVLRAT